MSDTPTPEKTEMERFLDYCRERGHYTVPKYVEWFRSIEQARKERELELKLEKVK